MAAPHSHPRYGRAIATWDFPNGHGLPQDAPNAAAYVYSHYERTTHRNLQQRYTDVATVDEIEALLSEERNVDPLTVQQF